MPPRTASHRALATIVLAFTVSAAVAPRAAAQGGGEVGRRTTPPVRAGARLYGTVVDAATGLPLAGVRIVTPSVSTVAVSDSGGRFDLTGIPPGLVRFHISAAGFPRVTMSLAFTPGEEMERTLELDSATVEAAPAARALPQMTIEADAPAPNWLRDFERRRSTGRGHYLTREQVESRGGMRLSDVVQTLRGVSFDCGGGGSTCHIRMTRAPMQCYPEYWVDGQLNNAWGPVIPVRDIEALEVYTGPSDTPGEFAGRNSGCGSIVIWTRAGPRAQQPSADRTRP